jgi:hypothetical protein
VLAGRICYVSVGFQIVGHQTANFEVVAETLK